MTKRRLTIGPGVEVDLDRLIGTRLLVQANSGGGKSWAIRRLLEQAHGRVQQIVIDPEGEFASLRERFDYILAARQGGDTLADPRTAKLLAERLLELGVSAICDIYELQPRDRVSFVKLFLEALVDAPKHLWHPVLVIVDEAHVYCPEKGHGEAESAEAVKGLATRGRKRGFCLVAATQRLSKLHKDVAAECNNKLIGRTSLDVDMTRAGDELGFTKADRLQLRDLQDGQFFTFGPALTRTVMKVKVGPVETTHPKAGSKLAAVVPPPTDKVKAVLSKLADLPAEAEAREKTVKDLKTEIATLKRDLSAAKKAQPPAPAPAPARDDKASVKVAELRQQLARRQRALDDAMKILVKVKAIDFAVDSDENRKVLEQAVAAAIKQVTAPFEKRVTALVDRVEGIRRAAGHAEQQIKALLDETVDLTVSVQKREPFNVAAADRPSAPPPRKAHPVVTAEGLTGAEQRILDAVEWWRAADLTAPSRHQVAFVAGYTVNGHFNNLVGGLRSKGLIDYPAGGGVTLTEEGLKRANVNHDEVVTREALVEKVLAVLDPSPGKIFKAVVDAGRDLTREELAQLTGYTINGHFNNMVGSLRSLGVIEYPSRGGVTLGRMFDALS